MAALLANHADPSVARAASKAPLLYATSEDNVEIAELLLKAGAQPDQLSAGQSALTAAGSAEMVRLLLSYKADPELADASGDTPLIAAARSGDRDVIRLLLAAGANPNAAGPGGRTPLMFAANEGCAKTLLAAKADSGAQDERGNTPLMHAAEDGHADVVRILIDLGADVRVRNAAGSAAVDLARAGETSAVVRAQFDLIMRRDLDRSLADAGRAAATGDPAAALARYLVALSQARQIGSGPEREVRVRILQAAATWQPSPPIPDAAHEHLVRAEALLKRDRGATEVEAELKQAIDLAPWWAEGYFNLGLVQGNDSQYNDAIATLNLFIAGAPNSPRVQAARDKIVEFQVGQEELDSIAALAGRWNSPFGVYSVNVKGDRLTAVDGSGRVQIATTIKDRALSGTVDGKPYPGDGNCEVPAQSHPVSGKISGDGKSIDLEYLWANYATHYRCVTMFNEVVACGGMAITSKQCDAVTITGTSTVSLRLNR